jgi:Family of unknown function (DUF6113)
MPPREPRPAIGSGRAVAVAAYAALFVLGAIQGLIGTFQYGRGPAPLAAICFDVAILVTCVLGSWGMRTAIGGVLPAAGWFLVTLILSSVSADGSVLVTASLAGEWFLFGGAVSAAAGAIYAFARWSRPSRQRRSLGGRGQGTRLGSGSRPAARGSDALAAKRGKSAN